MDRSAKIRIRRLSFGAVEARPFVRLGLVSVRSFVVRAQEEEKEQQEVEKVEDKSSGKTFVNSFFLYKN